MGVPLPGRVPTVVEPDVPPSVRFSPDRAATVTESPVSIGFAEVCLSDLDPKRMVAGEICD